MPHAQRNLEARRPPGWPRRQLFRRGACCFDLVIACRVERKTKVSEESERGDVRLSLFECLSWKFVGLSGKMGLGRVWEFGWGFAFLSWTLDDRAGLLLVDWRRLATGVDNEGNTSGFVRRRSKSYQTESEHINFVQVRWPCRMTF